MKRIILLAISVATLIGLTPFAADKIVSNRAEDKITEISASIRKQDPTATLTYNDISYDVFQNLITIDGLSYHSTEKGMEAGIATLTFTPVSDDPEEYSSAISELPENSIVQVKAGWLGIESGKLDDSNRKQYEFLAGADNKIEFSLDFKGAYQEKNDTYDYKSNFYIENAGTIDFNFILEEFSGNTSKEQHKPLDIRVSNLNLSFSTDNTKNILDQLFDVMKHAKDEDEFGIELEKLAKKLESEDNLKGFSKPIRDLSKSYYSGRKITLTISTTKPLDSKTLIAVAMMAQSANNPAQVANTMGLKLTSSLK